MTEDEFRKQLVELAGTLERVLDRLIAAEKVVTAAEDAVRKQSLEGLKRAAEAYRSRTS